MLEKKFEDILYHSSENETIEIKISRITLIKMN